MLTLSQASQHLHLHPNTLRRWTNEGKIPVYRVSSRGDRRFDEADIKKYLDEIKREFKARLCFGSSCQDKEKSVLVIE